MKEVIVSMDNGDVVTFESQDDKVANKLTGIVRAGGVFSNTHQPGGEVIIIKLDKVSFIRVK